MVTMTSGMRNRQPPDGALVRLQADEEAWAERIPPVPEGHVVTVSFLDAETALVHADALGLLGYRVVGVRSHPRAEAAGADFLVRQSVLEAHPTWWRALLAQADRAYNLAIGPVAASLADVLDAHLEPLTDAPAG